MAPSERLFSRRDLWKLMLPLVLELLLTLMVGMIDSVMVSSVGESAVSGVSLVDAVMQLLIYIFAALGTGGAVVAGQYADIYLAITAFPFLRLRYTKQVRPHSVQWEILKLPCGFP